MSLTKCTRHNFTVLLILGHRHETLWLKGNYFLKNFEGHKCFCATTDYPCLVTSVLSFKAKVDFLLASFLTSGGSQIPSGATPVDCTAYQQILLDQHTCRSCVHKH